ncbi:MAG: YitT family protein [Oscillospiraceae bacterium]|nr:YitT family protein [Oscillospiraceae bacterium]
MQKMKKTWTYLVICVIAVVAAFNYELFVFPNRFAPAGLAGLCTMIQYITGLSVGYMSLIINIPLALFTYFKVSKSMAKRSMVYVVVNSIALVILDGVDLSRFEYYTTNGTSAILGPLVAGIIWGFSYALLVRTSANSGGTDFIAAIIHKYNPEKNVFWLIFALNVFVACISYFVYDFQIEPVILCILYCFMSSTVSNNQSKSGRAAVRFEIVTDYPDEIGHDIIHKLHHSATVIPGRGMYMGKEVSVLICVVNKNQMAKLSAIVRNYPNTFAIMSSVNEVMGNFKKIDKSGKQEMDLLDHGDGEFV